MRRASDSCAVCATTASLVARLTPVPLAAAPKWDRGFYLRRVGAEPSATKKGAAEAAPRTYNMRGGRYAFLL
jgi:hypothetical protein